MRPWLVPIKKGDTVIPSMGGNAKSELQHQAHVRIGCNHAKCKYCPDTYECPHKELNLETDPEIICTIPDARTRAVLTKRPILIESEFERELRDTAKEMRKTCIETKDFKAYCDVVMDLWNKIYPTVQKNVNLNVETKDMAEVWAKELFEEKEKREESVECVVQSAVEKPIGEESAPIAEKEEVAKEKADSSQHVE